MNKKFIAMLFTVMLAFLLSGPEFADASSSQESSSFESGQVEYDSKIGEVVNTPQETLVEDSGMMQPFAATWTFVVNNGYQGLAYGSWIDGVAGPGPATLTLSKAVTVTNTYTGTLTAKYEDITAAVGFNISKAYTTTASYAVSVPKGKKYKIQYRSVYNKYKATQTTYSSGIGGTVVLGTDVVYPMKYAYLEYRYVEI